MYTSSNSGALRVVTGHNSHGPEFWHNYCTISITITPLSLSPNVYIVYRFGVYLVVQAFIHEISKGFALGEDRQSNITFGGLKFEWNSELT